jgi:hypothetical protein
MAKTFDFDPIKLPPEALQAIGMVVAASSDLENVLKTAIAGMLQVDGEYGYAVTAHMPTPMLLSALKSSAEIRIEVVDDLDELDELLKGVELALTKRNPVVHGHWHVDRETKQVYTFRVDARSGLRGSQDLHSIDKLKADAAFIHDRAVELFDWLREHKLLPPAVPYRPRFHKSKDERKKRRMTK